MFTNAVQKKVPSSTLSLSVAAISEPISNSSKYSAILSLQGDPGGAIGPQGPPGPKGEPGEPRGGYVVGTIELKK